MEVACPIQFRVLDLPQCPNRRFYHFHEEPRFSSFTILRSHKRASCKHPFFSTSHITSQSSLLGNPKKQRNVLRVSCFPKVEFFGPRFCNKLNLQNKLPRDVIVRSEITAAGSAGDGYSLPELKMEAKVRGVCFYAVTSFAAIFLFMLMLVGHPSVLMFDRYQRKFHYFVAKVWATLTVTPFFKIEYEGLENLPPPNTPAVYVSNHQSFLDIYTLLTLGRSFKFISKTGVFLFPVIGWAMFLLGVIPLKRMDSRSQMDCLKQCIDLIKKGASVFFFPEGTRSKDGKLGAFKKGAFSIAAKTNAPVVPITLIGTGQIMPAGREGMVNLGSVKVVIHKPIDGKDADMLCKEARNTIASVLIQA
ncbi:1-acyl-sn-glycerol-3-phosphate acyltransferase BAT2, chloroplastic isoform X2 [Cicer arietinum]|uniref:1-acyl-sn-glycerol-3-phosphate acyltransferase n=1 Tax=Cicer arietinum TaxID=3827 RepID=A0A1S3EJ64_CICAR|nr:1-acyl-sn-glycerol-3-phosphate acyltransferase 1, chloroplastic isoform X2 [Cicer arietinum]